MSLRSAMIALLVSAAWLAAGADQAPVQTTNGGGAHSTNATYQLGGALGSYSVLPPLAVSFSADHQLGSYFFPAVVQTVPNRNAADPAWLEIADAAAAMTMPKTVPQEVHACSLLSLPFETNPRNRMP